MLQRCILLLFLLCFFSSCNVLQWHKNRILRTLKSSGIQEQQKKTSWGLHHSLENKTGHPFLFIHGFGASAPETWEKQLGYFAKQGYRVFAPDLFWFGQSIPNSSHPFESAKEQADAIAHWMEQKNIPKAVVAGVSFGGYISLLLALYYPQKVSKLILVDSAGIQPTSEENKQIRQTFSFEKELQYILIPKKTEHLKIFLQKVFYKGRWIPEFVLKQLLETDFWKNKEEKRRIARHLEKTFLSSAQIQQIQHPTLLIWGKHDRIVPVTIGQRMKTWLPNSSLVILDKSGHIPMLEQPHQVNQAIQQFLQKTASSPRK